MNRMIFVFGSNEAGIHGKGAALTALQHYGAQMYVGWGLRGRSFAIPTKDGKIRTLPLEIIADYVGSFISFAESSKKRYQFFVTPIGCGLAGYKPEDIAPLFAKCSYNVYLPLSFVEVLS